MGNVIDAAVKHGTRLVYLDNVYAYGKVDGPMTEDTPIRPCSKKGQVRANALEALAHAQRQRGLRFCVARSADFYGPGATTSVINRFMIDKAAQGKPGTWLFDAKQPHSLTFTPDIGQAMAILGCQSDLEGTWHIPTASPLTGEEYAQIIHGSTTKTKVMSETGMRLGALFSRDAKESLELAYQSTAPYVFDSTKFESTFGVSPTSIEKGLQASISAAQS